MASPPSPWRKPVSRKDTLVGNIVDTLRFVRGSEIELVHRTTVYPHNTNLEFPSSTWPPDFEVTSLIPGLDATANELGIFPANALS